MGKISPVSAKYIVHARIDIEGVVDKPDIIGAVFGQTEGLLGNELELRELQRSGRIGRIEVNTETRSGKTNGLITLPSSLDKAETAIVAAALEIIQRIGPCNAKMRVEKIEDVRISKRTYVVDRAKQLLKNLVDNSMPDSQELADEVMHSVRVMEISEIGRDRLPAGPAVDDSEEIIIVEGRADVVNLLKHGIKNAVAMNGTSVPDGIVELCKQKIVTVFVDGDRGGELIVKSLLQVANIDFVTKAPDGKEVEELAKKEIHQAIRAKVVPQQVRFDRNDRPQRSDRPQRQDRRSNDRSRPERSERRDTRTRQPRPEQKVEMNAQQKEAFRTMSEELIGTRAAYLLDEKLNILGKVPVTEVQETLKGLNNVNAVVFDGSVDKDFLKGAEAARVKFVIGTDSSVKPQEARVAIATFNEL